MNVYIYNYRHPQSGKRAPRKEPGTFEVSERGPGGLAAQALAWRTKAMTIRRPSAHWFILRCAYAIAGAARDAGCGARWIRRLERNEVLDIITR